VPEEPLDLAGHIRDLSAGKYLTDRDHAWDGQVEAAFNDQCHGKLPEIVSNQITHNRANVKSTPFLNTRDAARFFKASLS
jgi:hypothetical protein